MDLFRRIYTGYCWQFTCILLLTCISSCTILLVKNKPKGLPYLTKNTFEVTGSKFTSLEREALTERLTNQLDDSAKIRTKSPVFFIEKLKNPPVFDTAYAAISANNMKASMYHLGYYNAVATYKADTTKKNNRVTVHYTVMVGNPTRIDTLSYRLVKPDLQALALKYSKESILVEGNPITKAAVLGEISRQVDTFRNNGYYKFSAAELRMRGDTTIEALTNVSDDPFEQLQILAEAQQQRDSPSIKLGLVLNKPEDTTKLNQYRINKIYLLQDYIPGDLLSDTLNITQRATRNFILRYHKPIFRTGFLARNITLRPGQVYSQREYNQTLSNLSKTGMWQTTNIQVRELADSSKVDLIAELVPVKKFGFEAGIEASYSATSNTSSALGGNLIGFSGNMSLLNRNIGREGIRMTHRLRAGIELNNNSRGTTAGLINSNEISYSNIVTIPRNISFWPGRNRQRNKPGESFINTSFSLNNRLNLFNLQSVNLNLGKIWPDKKNTSIRNTSYVLKP